MQITDRFWNQFENSLQFLDSLTDQKFIYTDYGRLKFRAYL